MHIDITKQLFSSQVYICLVFYIEFTISSLDCQHGITTCRVLTMATILLFFKWRLFWYCFAPCAWYWQVWFGKFCWHSYMHVWILNRCQTWQAQFVLSVSLIKLISKFKVQKDAIIDWKIIKYKANSLSINLSVKCRVTQAFTIIQFLFRKNFSAKLFVEILCSDI